MNTSDVEIYKKCYGSRILFGKQKGIYIGYHTCNFRLIKKLYDRNVPVNVIAILVNDELDYVKNILGLGDVK